MANLLWQPQLSALLEKYADTSERVLILYGSTMGTAEQWARQAAMEIADKVKRLEVRCMSDYNVEKLKDETKVLFFISTQAEGSPPDTAVEFCTTLEEQAFDFRVSKDLLAKVLFAVVGFGSAEYDPEHFCVPARKLDRHLQRLSARRMLPLVQCTDTQEHSDQLFPWMAQLKTRMERDNPVEDADADDAASESSASAQDEDEDPGMDDIEETEVCGGGSGEGDEKPEMVTKKHRAQLQKEGYKLIGSHSAVKLCRWTKHQLRGRGGCYKHTMYGITSYQCMEATPSLACANKCVFCWRHHKNPVGKSWRWKMDEPTDIVAQAIDLHVRGIKELKGVPGVKADRFAEAMNVRHCALSLVGEPIMYPRINELIADLHRRNISTFLVTNAQFPDAVRDLLPVTQLYLSVDAADKESLRKVDRPLFADFWERFTGAIDALREKQQRTVFRLTLVEKYNMGAAADYAKLVEQGLPDFVEIKAVTYCGTSKASALTMEHVPWHDDVVAYAKEMLAANPVMSAQYEIASEHRHSCMVLLAKRTYKIEGVWHTWIDYEKFHALAKAGKPFTGLDYAAPTPHWAVYGAKEEGFDPADLRHYRKKKNKCGEEGDQACEGAMAA